MRRIEKESAMQLARRHARLRLAQRAMQAFALYAAHTSLIRAAFTTVRPRVPAKQVNSTSILNMFI